MVHYLYETELKKATNPINIQIRVPIALKYPSKFWSKTTNPQKKLVIKYPINAQIAMIITQKRTTRKDLIKFSINSIAYSKIIHPTRKPIKNPTVKQSITMSHHFSVCFVCFFILLLLLVFVVILV